MTADGAQSAAHGDASQEPDGAQQWNSDDLLTGWREAGVRAGMHLIVHSALSSLGLVNGGAHAVVDSLRRAVGSTG